MLRDLNLKATDSKESSNLIYNSLHQKFTK